MSEFIKLMIQLSFELGQAYQVMYEKAELDNVIDFKNIAVANSRCAEWNLKGEMSNIDELFKLKDKNKIEELNKIAKNLEYVKTKTCEYVTMQSYKQ